MTTAELASVTRVHPKTILKMVRLLEIPADPVGGSHGYEFSEKAPEQVKAILKLRHRERVELRRKNRTATANR